MTDYILNFILLRKFRAERLVKQWRECMESEFAEEFLELLLKLMSLVFLLNYKDFSRNISGFNGSYLFKSKDDSITVSAVFRNGTMKVKEKTINDANITVVFKNGKALMNYILSPKPDILGSLLNQDVTFNGNLNFLYKFAYMAKRLQLLTTGQI